MSRPPRGMLRAAPPFLPKAPRRIRPRTWCTKTSTGESRVAPPLAVMERKPKPMRTLNHLQMPEPCRGWDSFSALGESPTGSSPGFSPGERPTERLSRGAGGDVIPPAQPARTQPGSPRQEPQILPGFPRLENKLKKENNQPNQTKINKQKKNPESNNERNPKKITQKSQPSLKSRAERSALPPRVRGDHPGRPGNEGSCCRHDTGAAWSGGPKSVLPSKT